MKIMSRWFQQVQNTSYSSTIVLVRTVRVCISIVKVVSNSRRKEWMYQASCWQGRKFFARLDFFFKKCCSFQDNLYRKEYHRSSEKVFLLDGEEVLRI